MNRLKGMGKGAKVSPGLHLGAPSSSPHNPPNDKMYCRICGRARKRMTVDGVCFMCAWLRC